MFFGDFVVFDVKMIMNGWLGFCVGNVWGVVVCSEDWVFGVMGFVGLLFWIMMCKFGICFCNVLNIGFRLMVCLWCR